VLADAGGGPGSQVCETVGVVIDDDSGDLAIDLVTSCTIPPGTYWLAVQANLDYGADHDQWFWDSSESASGATARWRNPDAGFPTLCTDWETLPDCYGSGERSFLFEDDFESGTTSAWSGVVP
jgi:hypothetical protein